MKCIQCIFHNDNWWIPHASHNRSNSADGSFYTTGIFHGGRKSRADLNKPEDRRPFATYNFERDGALFIGTFAAAHGEARAELRVFPCAWAARSWVNYLDKSAWPPVCALWWFSEAQNWTAVLNPRAKGDERAFLLSIMCHLTIYLVAHKYCL